MTTAKQMNSDLSLCVLINCFTFYRKCGIHSGTTGVNQKLQPNPHNNAQSVTNRLPTAKMANMTDIGSRSLFGPDQDAFRETTRKFFAKEVVPHYSKFVGCITIILLQVCYIKILNFDYRWEDQGFADKKVWEKAGEYGLLGVNIPAEHGGIGGSFIDAAIVMEEMYALLNHLIFGND